MKNITDILKFFKLSGKSKIAIIGKGKSLDKIDISKLSDFFVININDSEQAYSGNIGIYHLPWVSGFLKEKSLGNCDFYITSDKQDLNNPKIVFAEHIHEDPENISTLQERFFDQKFYLEDATVISALKLANLCADHIREKLDVFLLGFDFSVYSGFTTRSKSKISPGDAQYVDSLFNSQKAYLELILSHSQDLSINVNHIGEFTFSSMNCEEFNSYIFGNNQDKYIPISSDSQIYRDDDFKVKIVAEITTNHFGDLELLHKMIRAAAEAGADYIKLQKRDVESFYSQDELNKPYNSPFGKTFRDYRHGLELDEFGFQMVDKWCKKYGIKWFASVLDLPSYEFIKKFAPELVKLPSTISEHTDFLTAVADDFEGDVVLSTGMTDTNYENFVLDTFNNCRNLYLLQCVSSYPTMNEDANVAVVRHYHDLSKKHPRIIPGYSSHDVGSLCCQLSVAAGGLMVEKHVKYGNTPWAHFDNVAIDMLTDNFTQFVRDIRIAEVCLGKGSKEILKAEHHKYKK